MSHHSATTGFRRPAAWRAIALAIAPLALVGSCDLPGKPDPANRPVLPDQVLDFRQLYAANCAGCHGATGELGPAPPLNDPLFVAIVPDDELLRVIREGRAGTPMPPFAREKGGSLTEAQVKALAEGIKSQWKSTKPLEESPPEYALSKDGGAKSTPDSIARGTEVFERACAECHGPNGAGDPEGSIGGAIHEPAFLALISDQALRRIIITGRPDLGMPTYAEQDGRPSDFQPLSSAEIDDLVALLANWRAAPAVVQADQKRLTPTRREP